MRSSARFTAMAPIASIGWRTVVRGGEYKLEAATSSKPITEQCSGTAAGFGQCANGAEGGHVVEGHKSGERALAVSNSSVNL